MFTEEILLSAATTGTTVFYFVPNVTPELVPILQYPTYLTLNPYGVPVSYSTYDNSGSTEIWTLSNVNGYEINTQLSSTTTNYLTGYSFSQTFNKTFSANEQATIRQAFTNNITAIITAQTNVSLIYPTYVFFNVQEVSDMYTNVKLVKSFETLDTLQIYNNPINSITQQNASTGVLFGKLQAIQTLKDSDGNNIKIPLVNVPIGIFNPTTTYPAPTTLDDNGDRFFLNIKENSEQSQYFDTLAYGEDQKILRSQSMFASTPDQFKYITITNENGEFIIYNAPAGNNTLVFEVDLFKQGLSKDEIVLNNFPFPTDDNANIGQFPCYYYNQVAATVVPAWGTFQTGYTEINVNVNLDLRKWATYIFPPASYGNEKLEVSFSKNANSTLKVQVRDMTNPMFATKVLETSQIPNDLDRRDGSKYYWFSEIEDQRQQFEFETFGCYVVKMPANLYDPNGYKTDSGGTPTTQRGLWLATYQFRAFVDNTVCIRDTGGSIQGNSFFSHFAVNYTDSTPNIADFSGIGIFPYEKPWSLTYPEPYQIPAVPTRQRFQYGSQRTYGNGSTSNPYILEEPAYSDGDLVGNVVVSGGTFTVGGFGAQKANGVWFPNRIGLVATQDYMYKYESGVRWDEEYANGFQPYWSVGDTNTPYGSYPLLIGASKVINGEKYQRVECGYGYFMKYRDWPRVFRYNWTGDDRYFDPDMNATPGTTPSQLYLGGAQNFYPIQNNYNYNTYNLNNQNLAFAFDQLNGYTNAINQDGIDIYRIVNSGIADIQVPQNFVIPTFVQLQCDQTSRCGPIGGSGPSWLLTHTGQYKVTVTFNFNTGGGTYGPVFYTDGNGNSGIYNNGTSIVLYPGGTFYSFDRQTFSYIGLTLPGNSNLDTSQNIYTTASYSLEVGLTYNDTGANIGTYSTPINLSAQISGWGTYWVSTEATGASHGIYQQGLSDDFKYGGSTYYWNSGSGANNHERPVSIFVSSTHYNGAYQGEYI